MNIIIDSKFNPYTFEDRIKPLERYATLYNDLEEKYAELSDKMGDWLSLANEENSPISALTVKDFNDRLQAAADSLSRGASLLNRRAYSNLKRGYSKDIKPIIKAAEERKEQIKALQEGRLKGVVYERDASTLSLDEMIKNPSAIIGAVDSNAGYTRLGLTAQALSKSLVEARITGNLDKYTKAFLQKYGYDVTDVQSGISQALADLQGISKGELSSAGSQMVYDLLQGEMQAAGILNWDTQAKAEYLNKVAPALYQAVGPMSITPMENFENRSNLTFRLQKELEQIRHSNAIVETAIKLGNKTNSNNKPTEYQRENLQINSKGTIEATGKDVVAKGYGFKLQYDNKNGYVAIKDLRGNYAGHVNKDGKTFYFSKAKDKTLSNIVKNNPDAFATLAAIYKSNKGEAKLYNYYVDEDGNVYQTANSAHALTGGTVINPVTGLSSSSGDDLYNNMFGVGNSNSADSGPTNFG